MQQTTHMKTKIIASDIQQSKQAHGHTHTNKLPHKKKNIAKSIRRYSKYYKKIAFCPKTNVLFAVKSIYTQKPDVSTQYNQNKTLMMCKL